MAMTLEIDVKQAYVEIRFLSIAPKIADRETGEQKRNNEGVPMYTAQILVQERESGKAEAINVTIPAVDGKSPAAGISLATPINLSRFRAGSYVDSQSGRARWFYAADAILQTPTVRPDSPKT